MSAFSQYHHSRKGVGEKRKGFPVSESRLSPKAKTLETEGVQRAVLAERSDACRDEWWYWLKEHEHPEFWDYTREELFR